MFMASEDKHPKLLDLEERARLFLKAEVKRADITYEELADRLKRHGFKENAASIANKLARGTFSAAFFLAVMKVLERDKVSLEDV